MILKGMKYKPGDLVWVVSAFGGEMAPAIVISAYEDYPKIFLHNERENRRWLEEEDIGMGWVYDIMLEGRLEESISEEWLAPYKKRGRQKPPSRKKQ